MTLAKHIELETIPCPVCNEDKPKLLYPDATRHTEISLCTYCGHIFKNKTFNDKSWKEYIKHHHRSAPIYQSFVNEKGRFYHLKSYLKNRSFKRILDIGSRLGFTANKLNAVGYEPSLKYWSVAKSFYPETVIHNGLTVEESSFDLIIIYNHLALIKNPVQYLESLKEKLTENGVILIGEMVIDIVHILNLGNPLDLATQSIFTDNSLKNVFASAGYSVESVNSNHFVRLYEIRPSNKTSLDKNPESNYNLFIKYLGAQKLLVERNYMVKNGVPNEKANAKIMNRHKEYDTAIDIWFSQLQQGQGNEDKTLEILDEIKERFPRYIPVMAFLAQVYAQFGDLNQSIELFQRCLEDCEAFDLHESIARSYYDLGIYDLAYRHFMRAIEMNPAIEPMLFDYVQSCAYLINKSD